LCHNPIWQKPKSCQTGQLYAFAKLAAGFDFLWLRGGATRKEREAGEPKKNWPGVEAEVFHQRAIRHVVTGIGPGDLARHLKLLMVPPVKKQELPTCSTATKFTNMETSLPLDRRTALKLGLGTGIGGLLGLTSTQAEERPGNQQPSRTNVNVGPRTDPPPLVDARFPCEIAEDVWVIPDRRTFLVPNIGIVVGKEAALVIDCGLGPGCGQDVIKAAERVAPGRRLILTQTHAHPEHAFGAVAFKNRAKIFLNRQQNDYLARIGPTMLQLFRERYGEQVRQILEGAEIVQGTDLYDSDHASLDLGGRQVDSRLLELLIVLEIRQYFFPKRKYCLPGT
jgi:hypothetical protein